MENPLNPTINVVDYNLEWEKLFEQERDKIREILHKPDLQIEHIGGTSVSDLKAIPIIDMMIKIGDMGEAKKFRGALETLGYEYIKENEDSRPKEKWYKKYLSRNLGFHIHITEPGTIFWVTSIRTRDYLKKNPELVKECSALKTRLAKEVKNIQEYDFSKLGFNQKLLSELELES